MKKKNIKFTKTVARPGGFKDKTWLLTFDEFAEAYPEYADYLKANGKCGDAIGQGLWFHAAIM